MESSEDKQWASKYLLDPLNAPQPSEETGPGTHFRSSVTAKRSPPEPKTPSVKSYPTPPTSASPTNSAFPPSNPFSSPRMNNSGEGHSRRGPEEAPRNGKGVRRSSSLSQRYVGDMSHRPLDQIRKENKAANRSPHLKKHHIPGADVIDSLDRSMFGGPYHHEGPYDAALLVRNTSLDISPLEAVRGTNEEALRATPQEYIRDALDKHVPLQGTAIIPPGMRGMDGKVMNYKEGADLMRERDAAGGAYKRWDHVKYHPEDYKGKGEAFELDRSIKQNNKGHRRYVSEGGLQMQPQSNRPQTNRNRSQSGNIVTLQVPENDVRRANSTGGRFGEGLKKRLGSLRRSKKNPETP